MLGFNFFRKKRKYLESDIEPHEVFIDTLAEKKEKEIGISKKRIEVHLSSKKMYSFVLFCFFVLFVLIGRSFYMQIIEKDYYSLLAARNFLSISSNQTERGIIYDREGNQLVYNNPRHDLYFQKTTISSAEESAIKEVAQLFGYDFQELLEKADDSKGTPVLIKKGLAHEDLVKMETKIEHLSGFYIESSLGRKYEKGEEFAHILGYIGKIDIETLKENPEKYKINDYVGKTGVERYYEDYLSRAGDKIEIERDVVGDVKERKIVDSEGNGENIVLTIDPRLQEISYQKIIEKLEETGLKKVSLVAIDPSNGEILAMVSTPTFDNNIFNQSISSDSYRELFENKDGAFLNRTISIGYPTGSVIKPLLAVAALEEGIISPEKEIYSKGYITVPNPWNPSEVSIFRDFQAHGWRDMREAIAVSSNVYFYSIGGGYEDQEGLGATRINKYLRLFGWGEKTGVDIYGEKEGFIPTPEWKKENLNDIWRIGDTYNLSIGQGYLSATPLQVTTAFASIVNGGVLLEPHIAKEIIDDDGVLTKQFETVIIRDNIAKQENLEVVKEGMKKTVEIGTGKALQEVSVSVGAKTGTAQTSKVNVTNSLISLFAPYDNPEIVMTIVVEEIDGVVPVAVHLARDILSEYYKEPSVNN
jgi:penicillin-binding protein 2